MNGKIRPSRRDSAGGQFSSSSKRRISQKKLASRKSNDLFVGDEDEELPRRGSLQIDTNSQSIQQQHINRSSRRKPKHASSMKNVLQSKLSSKSKSRGQGAPSYAQERKSNMNESVSTKSTSRNSRNSRNKQRSTTTSRGSNTKPTSNQQHSSSTTDGRIDIIIDGHTNTSTKIQNTPTTTSTSQIKPSYTTATSSSTNSSIHQQQTTSTTLSPRDNNSARTQTDVQTRRRNPIQIIQTINSEDNIECDIPHLDSNIIDTSIVYTNKFRGGSASMSLLDIEKLNLKEDEFIEDLDANSTTSTNGTNREEEKSTLGDNGWHRALNVITTSSTNDISPNNSKHALEISSPNKPSSTLDQLTVTHLLQNIHPQIDEYDAIYEEYIHLKSEIKALEKDRIELEKQFHEAGKVASQEKIANESNKLSYQTFRTNLRYMKSDDIKSLPVLWLEDVPLSSSDEDSSRRSNNKLPYYTQLDTKFQQQIRNYRGTNLALLITDKQCKTSIIGRTCSLNNINTESLLKSSSTSGISMLQREGSATLIDGGGELLNHVAITGYDDKSSSSKTAKDIFNKSKNESSGGGTTYILKFDNGKTHHRGNLPSNLLARLYRERKDYTSIKYLSTGCTYSIGNGHRCYYCEFDTGECWWGTNKDDMLDDVFMNVDVHRVAFGSSRSNNKESSSWIVIGKDGSVKWKNVPQGLHDLLMKHMETTSKGEGLSSPSFSSVDHPATPKSTAVCPCEVSLGIGGTYFIRFIDGSFDYSLPNFVANVVDKFESDGRLIRNLSLHMETYDCLIRYSNEMLEC